MDDAMLQKVKQRLPLRQGGLTNPVIPPPPSVPTQTTLPQIPTMPTYPPTRSASVPPSPMPISPPSPYTPGANNVPSAQPSYLDKYKKPVGGLQ